MPINIFFCYAHEDEELLNKLKAQLMPLKRQHLIDVWHDRDINAGTAWEQEIDKHLNSAQLILLLISPDFMNSEYCSGIEMKRALERHKRGEAYVSPVILRPVYWEGMLGGLQALPKDGKPVTDRSWHNLDEALYNVAQGILKVVKDEQAKQPPPVGTTLLIYHDHTSQVRALTWSPDSKRLASASDKSVRVWDAITGKTILVYQGHSASVDSITWSPNSNRVASIAGFHKPRMQVWDAQDGHTILNYRVNEPLFPELEVDTPVLDELSFGKSSSYVVWSPDGKCIASLVVGTVKVWDAAKGSQIASIDAGYRSLAYRGYPRVTWSPDGKRIATVQFLEVGKRAQLIPEGDDTVSIFDAFTGNCILQCGDNSQVIATVAWSPDGKRIASGGVDTKVQVWDAITGHNILTYHGHSNRVEALAWSPDSKYLASGNFNTVHIWNVSTGNPVYHYKGPIESTLGSVLFGNCCITWSPDGTRIAIGGADEKVYIWQAI